MLLLRRLGLSYSKLKVSKLRSRFDPLLRAERSILALQPQTERKRYASALEMSLGPAVVSARPLIPIPKLIEIETGISPAVQTEHFISLGKANSYKFLRSLDVPWQKTKGFKRPTFVRRYEKRFGRRPYSGKKGESPFIYSYGELLEWFDVPIDFKLPKLIAEILT
ncbi:MAG TPA: hypothetical protein VIP46_17990 [Pyrinomonadaceae bacterium]